MAVFSRLQVLLLDARELVDDTDGSLVTGYVDDTPNGEQPSAATISLQYGPNMTAGLIASVEQLKAGFDFRPMRNRALGVVVSHIIDNMTAQQRALLAAYSDAAHLIANPELARRLSKLSSGVALPTEEVDPNP